MLTRHTLSRGLARSLPTYLRTSSALLLLFAAALVASGCSPTLTSLGGPAEVEVGREFELVVSIGGLTAPGCPQSVSAGVILQYPAGVTLLGHEGLVENNGFAGVIATQNTVQPPGMNIALEPGMQQMSFLRGGPATSVSYRVWFRAPPNTAALSFKVVLLRERLLTTLTAPGIWEVAEPPGVTSFAQVGPTHEIVVNVASGSSPAQPRWTRRGYFGALSSVQQGLTMQGLAAHDIDGDGVFEFRRRRGSTIDPLTDTLIPRFPQPVQEGGQVAVGDINGDGVPDVACRGVNLCDPTGALTPVSGPGLSDLGMAVGDVNGDGFADVIAGGNTGLICYLWNPVSQSLVGCNGGLSQSGSGRFLLLDDVDDDGLLDLVWTRVGGSEIFLGDGAAGWTAVPNAGLGLRDFWAARAADLDGDGSTDLVLSSFGNGIESGLAFFRRAPAPGGGWTWIEDTQTGLPTTEPYLDFRIVDLDGDGNLDIVAGRGISALVPGGIEIWRNLGGANFVPAPSAWTEGLPVDNIGGASGLAMADVDGDGALDIGINTREFGLRVYTLNPGGWSLPSLAGNVPSGGPGSPPTDILLVDSSAGGVDRSVTLAPFAPIRIDIQQPPSYASPADHFVFGTLGEPSAATVFPTPWGDFSFIPEPFSPQPGLFTLTNSIAPANALLPMGAAPAVFTAPGPSFPLTFTLQGVVAPSLGASNAAAVTNGIIVRVQ